MILRTLLCAAVVVFAACPPADALEPSNALDDAFTLPLPGEAASGAALFPGSEAVHEGAFITLGRRVPFGIDELTVTGAVAGYGAATGAGHIGLSALVAGTGFDQYGEDMEKLGIGWRPARWIAVGARLTRFSVRIAGFGDAAAWSGDVGAVIMPHGTVTLAAAVEDVAGAELGESREPLDGRFRAGAAWRPPGPLTLLAAVSRERTSGTAAVAGFIAEPVPSFRIGAAYATEPERYEFIAGVRVRGMDLSWRGSWHPVLGMTHGFVAGWE